MGFAFAARGPKGYEGRRLVRDLAVCTGVALALCGWWLVRNVMRYGDPLAGRAFLHAFVDRPTPRGMMKLFGLDQFGYAEMVMGLTAASTLGMFGPIRGNMFAFYPYQVYVAAAALGLLALIGFLVHLRREKPADWQRQMWWVSGLLGVLLLVSFIRFNCSFFQAQARYLFPALPAVALAVSLGLEQYAPRRYGSWVSLTIAGLLLVLALGGLSMWIAPQFLAY